MAGDKIARLGQISELYVAQDGEVWDAKKGGENAAVEVEHFSLARPA